MAKGLKLKFGIIISVLFVMWSCLGAYINFYRYEAMTGGEVQKDAQLTARSLATAVTPYMRFSNYSGLDSAVAGLTNEKDIAYIRVQDAQGVAVKESGAK